MIELEKISPERIKVLSEDFANAAISDAKKQNPVSFGGIYLFNASNDELWEISRQMRNYFNREKEKLEIEGGYDIRRVLKHFSNNFPILPIGRAQEGVKLKVPNIYMFDVGRVNELYSLGFRLSF